ncbi:hypothetical protein B0O99DRAFT_689046 [Bisporella sp. PMI_857]|nr:hypothetical protein B0O99DRAFT_689046 [Bisporella sp. PMI_857]
MAVRLATASDLTVTSRIAFRGFSLSPWNPFYRPYAEDCPQDVERPYLREQQEALGTPKKSFTVMEAETPASISDETGTKQVVGFAIWNLAASQAPKSQPLSVELVKFEGNIH